MSGRLRDYEFQISYGPADDRLHSFYIPALERSVRYDRSAGFFSSSALAVAAAGIARLIQNDGRMRLLVGAQLSEDDVAAIAAGHSLAERVANLYLTKLPDPEDMLIRKRLEALAWMVADGTLEIRVVLPVGPDGQPLPADQAHDYYHPKEGVFSDEAGDQIAFSGSVNESETAWVHNYEQFAVYRSWDATRPYLAQVAQRFERLWDGTETDWVALPIPEAVRLRLLQFRPDQAPKLDPLEYIPKPKGTVQVREKPKDGSGGPVQERLTLQFVRDAPYLPNAHGLGAATSAVIPWPHQSRVADAIVQRFPERFLLADEVGLGKTIEAGLAIRQLVLSGRVKRCLILTPKSVLRQWQEELHEKFVLGVPRYDGATFWNVRGEEIAATTPNPFDSVPLLLASSQLMKRRERQEQLVSALPWDLVVVDEAHHARRMDFLTDRYRPNRLLELLMVLRERTRGLILLTATPMQIDPLEVWDLLRVLGLGGKWGAAQESFLGFFRELRKGFDDADWNFVFDLVRDYFATGGSEDPVFAATALAKIGLVDWESIRSLPTSTKRSHILHGLSTSARAVVMEYAKRHTPLRRFVFRNTRSLLREYQRRGILKANVPHRDPSLQWIPMRQAERDLYERIEEYITHFYAKYESERKGLGFIMTVYRRRLTSSFYAIERSLERRLAFLKGQAQSPGLDDDDLEQDDLEMDVAEAMPVEEGNLFLGEIVYVEEFLRDLRQLAGDSKYEWLVQQLGEVLKKRETVIIFTQYADTMDYLCDQLRQVYGSQVACYSGRGGEQWQDGQWVKTTKEYIKNAFRDGERIKILVCTEAASEGLNLQTCGALINFDMPWNPMRVEQRIGRIDRIGQVHERVWIFNYFYEDTIEALVYQRLSDRIDWFTTVLGDLQPILSRVARSIQTLAMLPSAERQRRLEQEMAELRDELEQHQVAGLKLDEYLDGDVSAHKEDVPITLADLAAILTTSPSLRDRFKPHPSLEKAYLVSWHDSLVPVTFDPTVYDAHPDTVRLLSYGEPLLDDLLAQVEPPAAAEDGTGLFRGTSDSPVPMRAYYRPAGSAVQAIGKYAELAQVFSTPSELKWNDAQVAQAEADLKERLAAVGRGEAAVTQARRRAEYLALVERARTVLLRTALVELALGQKPTLFDQGLPIAFAESAITGLRRHKYPFAPLLHLVDVSGLVPSPTDPFFVSIQDRSDQSLRQQFENLKDQAEVLVKQLATKKTPFDRGEEGASDGMQVEVKSVLLAVGESATPIEEAAPGSAPFLYERQRRPLKAWTSTCDEMAQGSVS